MLVEKRQRYFRRYVLRWRGRAKGAPPLPLTVTTGPYSVLGALRKAQNDKKATASEGKDTIDLIKVSHFPEKSVIVLLFHRTSPNAVDPAYRRYQDNKVKLRHTNKEVGEDQVMSSHLVIKSKANADGGFDAALEEVPGLSASTILSIVRRVLHDFQYPYNEKDKELETNTTLTAAGIKSQSLTDALKNKSSLNYLTLTKSTPTTAPDGAGIMKAQTERVKYKIVGDPASPEWQLKFKDFIEGTKATWDDVSVEIKLEDDRQRTVKIDRKKEAAEIMFVRAELVMFDEDLPPCSEEVVEAVMDAAIKLMKS